jgi:hypothetical protein
VTPVVVESPYAGNVEQHLAYLRAAMADCISRGEAPFASHGLYTQPGVLLDSIPEERAKGIAAGEAYARLVAEAGGPRVFYVDLGWSRGMCDAFLAAWDLKQRVLARSLPGWLP